MKKILIVDDEEDILISIKELVESEGHEARTAINGGLALEMLKEEKFDLVLLDMLMPVMSGRKVLEKIRDNSNLKNQKVAFLTVVKLNKLGEKIIQKLKASMEKETPLACIWEMIYGQEEIISCILPVKKKMLIN